MLLICHKPGQLGLQHQYLPLHYTCCLQLVVCTTKNVQKVALLRLVLFRYWRPRHLLARMVGICRWVSVHGAPRTAAGSCSLIRGSVYHDSCIVVLLRLEMLSSWL